MYEELIPFEPQQISRPRSAQPQAGAPAYALSANHTPAAIAHVHTIANRWKGDDGRGYERGENILADQAPTLDATKPPAVAYAIQERAVSENPDAGPDGAGVSVDIAYTLEARAVPQAVAYGISNDCLDRSGEAANGSAAERSGLGITEELSPALETRPHAVAIGFDCKQDPSFAHECSTGLMARSDGHAAVMFKPSHFTRGKDGAPAEVAPPISTEADRGDQEAMLFDGATVRRLTPTEYERLQGFPDGYTLVPYRSKPASDSVRYKACGNSMPVQVMRKLGERIELVEQLLRRRAA